jgi:hypothetical protein
VKRRNLLWVAIVLLIGCGKSEPPKTPVARLDTETLTLEDIAARFDSGRGLSQAQLHAYIQRWITDEMLFREAIRRGLDRQPAIATQLEDIRRRLVINALLEQEVYTASSTESSAEDVRGYYEDHKNEFLLTNDVVLASFALFLDRESANAFRFALLRGTPWSQAFQSLDATQRASVVSSVDSMYFTQQTLIPVELWRTAMGIGVNNPSFPVRTEEGFYILIVWNIARRGQHADIAYVEREIRNRLTIERRRKLYDALVENLRAKHAVEVFVAPGLRDTTKHQGE